MFSSSHVRMFVFFFFFYFYLFLFFIFLIYFTEVYISFQRFFLTLFWRPNLKHYSTLEWMYISNGHFVYKNLKKEQLMQYRDTNNLLIKKKKKKREREKEEEEPMLLTINRSQNQLNMFCVYLFYLLCYLFFKFSKILTIFYPF